MPKKNINHKDTHDESGGTMNSQRTIGKEVTISGISLHLGLESSLTFKPAEPNFGVIFVRTDLPGSPQIKATIESTITGLMRQTSVGSPDIAMHTIEHVMAALAGLYIDNVIIESNAQEPPAMDGSSLPFVELLQSAGIVEQNVPRHDIQLTEAISVSDKDRQLVITPAKECKITYIFKFDNPSGLVQMASVTLSEESFIKEIAPSRTFCFRNEIEVLKSKGLGKGGSKDNVIVIDDNGKTDHEPRLENEMAMHKILDLVGDLYLLGNIPKAHIVAIKSGHELNAKLVQKLFEQHQKNVRINNVSVTQPLDVNEIRKILPHRYPFLLLDRVIELEEDKKAVAIKNVTANEEFFQGHFPQQPIMPGVLQIEALAQLAGVLLFSSRDSGGSLGFFRAIENVKFRRQVVPGDQLRLEVQLDRKKGGLAKFTGQVYVNAQITTEAEFTIAF
jgi:UDP-3-O-[3-hydroxymyristoyl] N-acetylglucosamine deacetylase/3-hydroxyacyl-[acyl-carrier-protein] dehydratase